MVTLKQYAQYTDTTISIIQNVNDLSVWPIHLFCQISYKYKFTLNDLEPEATKSLYCLSGLLDRMKNEDLTIIICTFQGFSLGQ